MNGMIIGEKVIVIYSNQLLFFQGLGSTTNHSENWLAHQDDFNALLSNLNQKTSKPTGECPLVFGTFWHCGIKPGFHKIVERSVTVCDHRRSLLPSSICDFISVFPYIDDCVAICLHGTDL